MSDGREQSANTAKRFVEARLGGTALSAYPGPHPESLAEAYRSQDAAIDLWPDAVAGWKIGLIHPAFREQFGSDRIAGPIFSADTQITTADSLIEIPVFDGGFAAIEAEFVLRIARDAPADRMQWSPQAAGALIEAVHIGIENAGSPFSAINDHGPAVTASDFGNNAGLIVGPRIQDWDAEALERFTVETFVNDVSVGRGDASFVPGGPLAALAFVLSITAARGRPLRKGQWISTGAVTGVHPIRIGESARAIFGEYGDIRCRAVCAGPQKSDKIRDSRKTL